MDDYLRDFRVKTIKTHTAENSEDCRAIFSGGSKLDFKLLHTNIRSINKNIDEFRILLTDLNQDFQCIALSETWRIGITDLYNIPGYNLLYNHGDINQNDGFVIYIKDSL